MKFDYFCEICRHGALSSPLKFMFHNLSRYLIFFGIYISVQSNIAHPDQHQTFRQKVVSFEPLAQCFVCFVFFLFFVMSSGLVLCEKDVILSSGIPILFCLHIVISLLTQSIFFTHTPFKILMQCQQKKHSLVPDDELQLPCFHCLAECVTLGWFVWMSSINIMLMFVCCLPQPVDCH